MRLLYAALAWSVFFWCVAVSFSNAASDKIFSCIPNSEKELTGYEIYCDKRANDVVQLDGTGHELWKHYAPDNVVDGRMVMPWPDFPDGVYNCVMVAMGEYDGKKLVSDFSNEITFGTDGITPPKDFMSFTVTTTVQVSQ